MTAKIQWPDSVPVLKPENMYAGASQKPGDENCRCLVGWVNEVFDMGDASPKVFGVLYKIIGGSATIVNWNDTHTPEERVEAWDKLCEALGYVEEVDA